MKKTLTYRYRLYPSEKQKKNILWNTEVSRRYYNEILRSKTKYFRETGTWKRKMPVLEQMNDWAVKYNVEPDVLKHAALEFDKSFLHFLWVCRNKYDQYKENAKAASSDEGQKELGQTDLKGYPEERKKNGPRQTYSVSPALVLWQNNAIMLPRIGWVTVKIHRLPPDGVEMRKITVLRRSSDRYYLLVEFQVCVEDKRLINMPDEGLGIVFYPEILAVRSDEIFVPVRHTDPALEEKISRAHKTLQRRTPGSNRYEKQRIKLAKLVERQVAQRRDTLHKSTKKIAESGKYIGIQVPSASRPAAYHRRYFNASVVRDEAWYTFFSMLRYKADLAGLPAYVISKEYPIWKICACCGYEKKWPEKQSTWLCPRCGAFSGNANNAARNIERYMQREISVWKSHTDK